MQVKRKKKIFVYKHPSPLATHSPNSTMESTYLKPSQIDTPTIDTFIGVVLTFLLIFGFFNFFLILFEIFITVMIETNVFQNPIS